MSNMRILVVDDDEDNCRLTQCLLTERGFAVDAVNDALTALRVYGEQTHDLVVLDYRMPDMDGLELLELLQQQWSNVAVIFYTGYATVDMVDAALSAGARRVIQKEVDTTALIGAVSDILRVEAE